MILMGLWWSEEVQTEWVRLVLLFKIMSTAMILLVLKRAAADGNTSLANLAATSLDIQDLEEVCAVNISRDITYTLGLSPYTLQKTQHCYSQPHGLLYTLVQIISYFFCQEKFSCLLTRALLHL